MTSDITVASLLATWPKELARYAIVPPRMLLDVGFISADEVWEVLEGFREPLAIWSKCCSKRVSPAKIAWRGRTIILKPSKADPDLWLAYDSENNRRTTSSDAKTGRLFSSSCGW